MKTEKGHGEVGDMPYRLLHVHACGLGWAPFHGRCTSESVIGGGSGGKQARQM